MHRIDWRVATAVACVGVVLVVLGFVAFGGDDSGDEIVQAQSPTETPTDTAEPAEETPVAEAPTEPPATAAPAPDPTATEVPAEKPAAVPV